jgi:hypothetical protein
MERGGVKLTPFNSLAFNYRGTYSLLCGWYTLRLWHTTHSTVILFAPSFIAISTCVEQNTMIHANDAMQQQTTKQEVKVPALMHPP